ncbi:hypothetical protein CWC05_12310 [Pseudoalteromonas ruthenica]|uniref:Uncharacterized protein n=1 Tax=Pseudoalteromonas ruthenica TaxID=151081 RepID=A0A5S3Z420_9GAMM|nr:hypothetical protein CWC05_12310 [Pseudoalteromonas ruthenica]
MSWYPDDKTWLKARKAQWKEVKESLKEMGFYSPHDMKLIKEYFLYGPDKEPMKTVNNDGGIKRKISYMGMVAIWLWLLYGYIHHSIKNLLLKNYINLGQPSNIKMVPSCNMTLGLTVY